MNQDFAARLQLAGNSRQQLLSMIEGIDRMQRSIKMNLTRLSSEPREGDPVGRERQVQIRRMKDKQTHLKTERELIKHKLAQIKSDQKSLNRAASQHRGNDNSFLHAFPAAAELLLDEETLNEVEARAAVILDSERINR